MFVNGLWPVDEVRGQAINAQNDLNHPNDPNGSTVQLKLPTDLLKLVELLLPASLNSVDRFQVFKPPYEYEFERLPIDLIIGDRGIRERLENLEPIDAIEAGWQEELDQFKKISREFQLYG